VEAITKYGNKKEKERGEKRKKKGKGKRGSPDKRKSFENDQNRGE